MENNKLSDVNSKSGSELIAIAHGIAANFESPATELLRELASRLECSIIRGDRYKKERDLYHNAEMTWEKAMMAAIGEDGIGSVTKAIEQLKADKRELQQKLDAMAAENAVLKDINAWCHTEAFRNMCREFKTAEAIGCPDVDCMHDAMLVAIMHAPPTPATDAYLNSVRAEGVEMFSKHCFDKKAIRFWDSAGEEARMFAVSLRSGTHDTADKEG